MNSRRQLSLVVVVGILVVGGGFGAGGVTYGLFFDSDSAEGGVQLASEFGYTGQGACIDTNHNWACDRDDIPVSSDEIPTFSNRSAVLIVPEHVGTVEATTVDITAAGLKTTVDLRASNGKVSLTTDTKRVQLVNATVKATNGWISISSGGAVQADQSSFLAPSRYLTVDADGTITARNSSWDIGGELQVTADSADLTDAAIADGWGPVSITATRDLLIDGASITTTDYGTISLEATEISASATESGSTTITTSSHITMAATEKGGGDLAGTGLQLDADDYIDLLAGGTLDVTDGSIATEYGAITVDGKRILASDTNISSGQEISVTATANGGGSVVARTTRIRSGWGSIEIAAANALRIDGSHVESETGTIEIAGRSVSATPKGGSHTVITTGAEITVAATRKGGGQITATSVEIDGGWGPIELVSSGDITIEDAMITTDSSDASAKFRGPATLYYDGLTIDDRDAVFRYKPRSVTENGTTDSGVVRPS